NSPRPLPSTLGRCTTVKSYARLWAAVAIEPFVPPAIATQLPRIHQPSPYDHPGPCEWLRFHHVGAKQWKRDVDALTGHAGPATLAGLIHIAALTGVVRTAGPRRTIHVPLLTSKITAMRVNFTATREIGMFTIE